MHSLRVLACGFLVLLGFPATARPYGVDDMLAQERFGAMLVSPGGRWLVFARDVPFDEAAAFHFNAMAVHRSRLYRVDLAHPAMAQPLLPIEPHVAAAAYGFSPDGRFLAVGRLDGTAWRLGVVTMATGAVRWFDLAPDYFEFRRTLAWVSNTKLVMLATPDGSLPWLLDLDTRSERETAQAWRDQEAGTRATVTAIGSGPARSVTPDHPDMALVLADVADGTTRMLARGPYEALSVSADGRYVAVSELRELVGARADLLLAEGTDQRRRRLGIVAIGSGSIWHPCPACDLSYAPLSWSPSGDRLAFFARDSGPDWSDGRVLVADADDHGLHSRPLGSIVPDLGGYPMTFARATIDWLARDPLLLARDHAGALEPGWYRLGDDGPVRLTGRHPVPAPDGPMGGSALIDKRRGRIAVETGEAGRERLLVRSGRAQPMVVARIDPGPGDVDPARGTALHYRLGDGSPATGWLYLPAHPDAARIPLIVIPYSGSVYTDRAPSPTGPDFDVGITNVQILVGHGYAVLLPSMPPIVASATHAPDYAGQVMPAVDAALATGLVDPRRLGLWGHSFGGYNGAMILTQTDRFAAGLVANSLYDFASGTGSFMPWTRIDPGQGQSILAGAGWAETGQPMMATTPWANPRAYVANSVLYRADRIGTPLMIVATDRDVGPLEQGEILFSALFRQDKDAQLLSYWGENHVLRSPANLRDFYDRAFAWFDSRFARAVTSQPTVEVTLPACPTDPTDSAPTRSVPSARPSGPAAGRHNDRCA